MITVQKLFDNGEDILCSYPNISFLHTKFIFFRFIFLLFWQTEHKKNASPEELTLWLFYYKSLLRFGYTQLVFFLIGRDTNRITGL